MEAFLREHLVRHRGASPHTCDSYAYSFRSLFEFASKKLKVAPSELTGLRMDDVAPQSASIRVRGKGRRERALPLWKTTAAALRAWSVIRGPVASPELFVNARGEPLSRWGVAYVLRRHTQTAGRKCSTLHGKQVSPHVLRHP